MYFPVMAKKNVDKKARPVAFEILMRVESNGAYPDILLHEELKRVSAVDRALLTELVYGVLRWRIKIDWIIDAFSNIKVKKLEHSVLNALRLGVYQIFFLTRIPPEAAIFETVELIKPYGEKKAGFVNAVLRNANALKGGVSFPLLSREPVKYISIVFSHPEWLVERWIKRHGAKDAMLMCQANLALPPVVLRTNTLKITRDRLAEELASSGIVTKNTVYSPDGLEVVEKGEAFLNPSDKRYYIQDEASQIVAYLVSPVPGEVILDACAAPGGKTTHLAQLMRNEGTIMALDKQSSRLRTVEDISRRLGVKNIIANAADASTVVFEPLLVGVKDLSRGSIMPSGGFDAILVDAPCSGLGVLRRTPDIKYKRTKEDAERLAKIQGRLLDNLAKYVRRGGRLVYSVCTFEPEETIEVAELFLKTHQDFFAEDLSGVLPGGCAGLVGRDGYFTSYPHKHGMDGFFAARFGRK